ncbi:MAG: hypothetical protein R3B09_01660 [Nannocystaceae bacterium]
MTDTEIETFKRAIADIQWVSDEELAWLKLRDQVGHEVARRIEHQIVLMVEPLAEAGWTDRQIREFLDTQRFREPEHLTDACREAAEALAQAAAEVGDDVTRTAIAFDTCAGGWPLLLEACEVRPRTERIKLR